MGTQLREARSSPGGERTISARCSKILRTSSSSVITARTRIGAEQQGPTKGATSYTWAMSLAQVERISLSEIEQGILWSRAAPDQKLVGSLLRSILYYD
jgi:hypothetical protein